MFAPVVNLPDGENSELLDFNTTLQFLKTTRSNRVRKALFVTAQPIIT